MLIHKEKGCYVTRICLCLYYNLRFWWLQGAPCHTHQTACRGYLQLVRGLRHTARTSCIQCSRNCHCQGSEEGDESTRRGWRYVQCLLSQLQTREGFKGWDWARGTNQRWPETRGLQAHIQQHAVQGHVQASQHTRSLLIQIAQQSYST